MPRRLKAFVSYSRQDRPIVEPVVRLLRVTRDDVFWDVQSIPLGGLWKDEIALAVSRADVIVVFWCSHARDSPHVAREWALGVALGKRVLPVVLDQTSMPPALGAYQGVDFRSIVGTTHGSARGDGGGQDAPPARRSDEDSAELHSNLGCLLGPLMLAVAVIAVGGSVVRFLFDLANGRASWADIEPAATLVAGSALAVALVYGLARGVRWMRAGAARTRARQMAALIAAALPR
jgi:hypothetical protein